MELGQAEGAGMWVCASLALPLLSLLYPVAAARDPDGSSLRAD